jgi:hypothetical protein
MSGHHDEELTHPLEQVTGEKDVTPEEEKAERRRDGARTDDKRDTGTADALTEEVPD